MGPLKSTNRWSQWDVQGYSTVSEWTNPVYYQDLDFLWHLPIKHKLPHHVNSRHVPCSLIRFGSGTFQGQLELLRCNFTHCLSGAAVVSVRGVCAMSWSVCCFWQMFFSSSHTRQSTWLQGFSRIALYQHGDINFSLHWFQSCGWLVYWHGWTLVATSNKSETPGKLQAVKAAKKKQIILQLFQE